MKYFKLDKNEIVKYEININKQEIEKIRKEIIDNCSIITHKCYKTNVKFIINDPLIYRNYEEKYIEEEKVYEISYDYYSCDTIIRILNELLDDNLNELDYLYNPPKLEKGILLKHIISLDDDYQNITFYNIKQENHALALAYIPEILKNITYTEIARFNLNIINDLTNFLEYPEINIHTLNLTKKVNSQSKSNQQN